MTRPMRAAIPVVGLLLLGGCEVTTPAVAVSPPVATVAAPAPPVVVQTAPRAAHRGADHAGAAAHRRGPLLSGRRQRKRPGAFGSGAPGRQFSGDDALEPATGRESEAILPDPVPAGCDVVHTAGMIAAAAGVVRSASSSAAHCAATRSGAKRASIAGA